MVQLGRGFSRQLRHRLDQDVSPRSFTPVIPRSPYLFRIYNWQISKYPPGDIGYSTKFQQLNFVPTIWGMKDIAQISSVLTQGYATTVKTFNEYVFCFFFASYTLTVIVDICRPNLAGQSNIPADEGCTLWNQHIQPLTQLGYRLIAPAVTTDQTGWNWLAEFMKVCSGASVRFMSTIVVWR